MVLGKGRVLARIGCAWDGEKPSRNTQVSERPRVGIPMDDISGIWMVAGSRGALRPSMVAALKAAHELWARGERIVAILRVGTDDRLDADGIIAGWRELGLPVSRAC
jgi:hypothetical protein